MCIAWKKRKVAGKEYKAEGGNWRKFKQNKAKESKDRRRDLLAADKEFHTYKAVLIKCVKVTDDSYQNICLWSSS